MLKRPHQSSAVAQSVGASRAASRTGAPARGSVGVLESMTGQHTDDGRTWDRFDPLPPSCARRRPTQPMRARRRCPRPRQVAVSGQDLVVGDGLDDAARLVPRPERLCPARRVADANGRRDRLWLVSKPRNPTRYAKPRIDRRSADDCDRDQDRQSGQLGQGAPGARRVGRRDRIGDRRGDPGRLPRPGPRTRESSASRRPRRRSRACARWRPRVESTQARQSSAC